MLSLTDHTTGTEVWPLKPAKCFQTEEHCSDIDTTAIRNFVMVLTLSVFSFEAIEVIKGPNFKLLCSYTQSMVNDEVWCPYGSLSYFQNPLALRMA